ncbi:hypothetical protein ACTJJ8_06510 [Agrobacterium radiobacter]|jgi:hypothetical protein|nr:MULTISPECIES: hypothetical protein [Agrobacterium]MCW8055774.1 hypothetical protein [Agrobacterium tumefaciens]MCW8145096.1 hypothetical protein [Agrobacterium tumefaciens]NTA47928.1 hypothetical protein [Agrobacterium tumefaciens]NTE68479.1 hypothetical protein [Agrobacterium tumefaciens]NTE91837.1 hypothetical protein [Agrobacterium tumefaciens]
MRDINGGAEMKNASILFGLFCFFLASTQNALSQPVGGNGSPINADCQFEIPPCETPIVSVPGKPPVSPPPAAGGGGIHNLPGASVFKETIIIPGNNMFEEFKLDQPKMLEMQKQLQNRSP